MVRCPICSAEIAAASRFCAACGAPLAQLSPATSTVVAITAKTASSSGSIDEGRFEAGTLLASRYKVIALAGRGGMGEVYRAYDLKLGQAVALKFLPEQNAVNQQALARFHNEVRIARRVSHPNVCRVHDIGEAEGMAFISMEYVDGEDLGSLLRRIGRLPGDKALEIGRRLCAGLAAAHDKGVLHRDLKPGNVMIDGRGQVLITDFGLAGMAGQVEGGEIRNGTPAYMAPEQIAGKEVSVQSDIYSLGLVLYEMVTGKRAFEDRVRGSAPLSVSSLVKDADPAVEGVIQRCLEDDPGNRPQSALAVAAMLPGGDPLADALAAGETPSPDVVAAAGDKDLISVRAAVFCLACVLVGMVGVVVTGDKANLLRKTPFEKPPEELAAKSRDLIRQFGFTAKPADTAYGFEFDNAFLRYAQQREKPETFQAQLAKAQPPVVFFWYRQSPYFLVSPFPDGIIREWRPRNDLPGMVDVNLDGEGRLTYLFANVSEVDEATGTPPPAADWSALFAAAGLDQSRFVPSKPKMVEVHAFDTRAAWAGSFEHAPEVPLRIEAASWKGQPVFFEVFGPWVYRGSGVPYPGPPAQERVYRWLWIIGPCAVLVMAALLAIRNYRLGRGDTRGAARLALFALICSMLRWACNAKHHADVIEYDRFVLAMGAAVFSACAFGTLYLALEPYVRRRLPHTLITWTRVLSGRWRDPLVGGHMLIGLASGVTLSVLFYVQNLAIEPYGSRNYGPGALDLDWLLGGRHMVSIVLDFTTLAVGLGLGFLFLYFLLCVGLRREWLALGVLVSMLSGLYAMNSTNIALSTVFLLLVCGWSFAILTKYGVLAFIAMVATGSLNLCPMTTDFAIWYASSSLVLVGGVLVLAVCAFYLALAGRTLLRAQFLEE